MANVEMTPYPTVTLTAAQWAAFTDKQRWDVITALRGPDMGGSLLKLLTTAVIRGEVQSVLRTDGTSAMVVEQPRVVLLPAGYANPSMSHFCGHVADAASVLGLPIGRVPWQVYQTSVIDKERLRSTDLASQEQLWKALVSQSWAYAPQLFCL